MGRRDELKFGELAGVWEFFEGFGFLGVGQRRGTDVSVPKIGSRAA
jgi:hypothetical protein